MKLVLGFLMLSMLSHERAHYNAANTLHAWGVWGSKVACMREDASSDTWVCIGDHPRGVAWMLCAGSWAEPCTFEVRRPR